VGMAWILVKVTPKTSSRRAGWIARVYSSVRSWRSLASSSRHSVAVRFQSSRMAPGAGGRSAEPTGGAEAADGAKASLVLVGSVGGVRPEDVLQGRLGAERRLQLPGAADRPQAPVEQQPDPVAEPPRS
jgi:hypothetical protein